jgi:hypothetical protein
MLGVGPILPMERSPAVWTTSPPTSAAVRAGRPPLTLATAFTAVAVLAAAGNAAIHLYLAPEHTNAEHVEMGHAYVGVLFAVAGIALATVVLALALTPFRRVRAEAWWFGALLSAGMAGVLVVSRVTTWMPNGYQEPWDPLAVATLVTEGLFLAAFGGWLTRKEVQHR